MKNTLAQFLINVGAALALALAAAGRPSTARSIDLPSACHVNAGVVGGANNGSSWADAYADLQDALANPACTEIWVAAGVYKPGLAGERGATFQIGAGVAVYGGFDGTEMFRWFRDPAAHVTILSGDIDGDDINKDGNFIDETVSDIVDDNSYHVVTIYAFRAIIGATTVLDGFTITGGKANGDIAQYQNLGGGVLCRTSGNGAECSPNLQNLNFSGNQAGGPNAAGLDVAGFGGGLANDAHAGGIASAALTNVTFHGNFASLEAGAMYDTADNAGVSSPILHNVIFLSNGAVDAGGAMENAADNGSTSSPQLTNVVFSGNAAGEAAGMANWAAHGGASNAILLNVTFSGNLGGAMYNVGTLGGTSSPTLTNVTFSANSAPINAGAVQNHAYGVGSTSSPSFTNVTFNGNSAGNGGAMNNLLQLGGTIHPVLTNVILWGDTADTGPEMLNEGGATATLTYSVVQGGCASIAGATCDPTDLSTDPLLAPLGNQGGFTQTMPLITGSPAIDTGTNIGCPATDQRGLPRPVNVTCDIGAVEYQGHLFADVPVTGKEWMEPWIDAFYYNGITTGCGVGPLIYCPENNVTRAEMAVFILRAKHGAGYTPPPAKHSFDDVPVPGKEWMEPWIDQFYAEGITTGCGVDPLRYCPEQNVTRAEMAVFIIRAIHAPGFVPPAATHIFFDVPVAGKEWMEPWIEHFYSHGITTGCGIDPLRFCPENNTTRAEMAVFIDRAYGIYP